MLGFLKELISTKQLQERVAKLERVVDERDLDWLDMRARCKRLLDRTEKAAGRISNGPVLESNAPTEEAGGEQALSKTANGRLLSSHQLTIQQQILRRRAGGQ